MTTDEMMLASEAAREMGVSHTYLLQLTQRGVVPLAARTESGWRLYRTADIRRLAEQRRDTRRKTRTPRPPAPAA